MQSSIASLMIEIRTSKAPASEQFYHLDRAVSKGLGVAGLQTVKIGKKRTKFNAISGAKSNQQISRSSPTMLLTFFLFSDAVMVK